MNLGVWKIFYIFLVVGSQDIVLGQPSKISSKLDFMQTENNTTDSISGTMGTVKTKSDEYSVDSSSASIASSSNKTRPKIHGVRVSVDTGDMYKSKESQKSVEIAENEKQTKRVSIHTDLTFEITAGNDNSNVSNSAEREDASVPMFKGRSSVKTRPHDDKSHWVPIKGHDNQGQTSSSTHGSYYPQYVPKHQGTADHHDAVSQFSPKGDGWNSYVPLRSVWTTERYDNEPYRPTPVIGYRTPIWKPCYCVSS